MPQNAVDHVRDLGASSVEQVLKLTQYSPTSWCSHLVPASSTAVLACPSANYHFRHSCLWWKHWCHGFCPTHLHNEDIPCMSTTLDVLSLVSAWLPISGLFSSSWGREEEEDIHHMHFAICLFSSWAEPLCRDNAPSLRSLGKISLSHMLFAVVKELLGLEPILVFCGKRTVRENPLCLVLLGNETPVPCRTLRKPVFSKDCYV